MQEPEKAAKSVVTVQTDDNIDIAFVPGLIAGVTADQPETDNAEASLQFVFMRTKECKNLLSVLCRHEKLSRRRGHSGTKIDQL
ncbi:hypothetical protein DESUT3_19120 [Desulfuromonas versatilis]|uniref:Uncharacterized protein n=1 Tax=Desulfuromonas versatilis TaxID=2802975 RepID=A0ABM8HVV8_9BACT|nr:hypothetical protein DESUT3_19120 [Desulfuromonas versatilis]